MKEFIAIIFGSMSFACWLAYLLLAIIGSFVFTATEVNERDVLSDRTPFHFSLRFLALDNLKRYALTLLLIFIQMRFWKDLSGSELTPYTSLLMGFSMDGIAGFSKRVIPQLQADREKLLKTTSNEPA